LLLPKDRFVSGLTNLIQIYFAVLASYSSDSPFSTISRSVASAFATSSTLSQRMANIPFLNSMELGPYLIGRK